VSAKVAGRFSQVLLENLEQYGANDSVPIALIDAASIASIRSRMPSGLAATFVLPSHFIWLARSAYYAKNYPDSLEYARKALGLPNLMTGEARVEALRWRGLASARLRLESEFNEAMSGLAKEKGARADGNLHFLKGFNHRLRGELSRAHAELSIASRKLRKSIDVERELVGVLIARRDFHAALERARTLITRAEDNPYVLDGYLQAKLGLTGKAEELDYDVEFQKCLRRLREVGHGDGLAFYSLRMCDYNLLAGRKQKALESAVAALDLAPRLPACHAAKVRALVALDELDKAWEAIGTLEGLGRVKDTHRNGFEDLLLFQERFEYNLKKKRFSFCRKDVDNISRIDADLAKFLKTELVGAVLRSGIKIDPELTLWLKK
jgi:tetratricopeptide (TPR) repeat protein